jgi:hypothetical protein
LEIPIREISDNEQNPFVKLVDHILVTKRASPQTDTSTLGREIDKIVYELYGLTDPLPASPKFQKRGIWGRGRSVGLKTVFHAQIAVIPPPFSVVEFRGVERALV